MTAKRQSLSARHTFPASRSGTAQCGLGAGAWAIPGLTRLLTSRRAEALRRAVTPAPLSFTVRSVHRGRGAGAVRSSRQARSLPTINPVVECRVSHVCPGSPATAPWVRSFLLEPPELGRMAGGQVGRVQGTSEARPPQGPLGTAGGRGEGTGLPSDSRAGISARLPWWSLLTLLQGGPPSPGPRSPPALPQASPASLGSVPLLSQGLPHVQRLPVAMGRGHQLPPEERHFPAGARVPLGPLARPHLARAHLANVAALPVPPAPPAPAPPPSLSGTLPLHPRPEPHVVPGEAASCRRWRRPGPRGLLCWPVWTGFLASVLSLMSEAGTPIPKYDQPHRVQGHLVGLDALLQG